MIVLSVIRRLIGSMHHSIIGESAMVVGCTLFILLTAANITSFHFIPYWYRDIIAGKQEAFIRIAQRAQGLPFFEELTEEMAGQLTLHNKEIYEKKHSREEIISKLTSSLASQPNSTEILRALMILYRQDGNEAQVQFYLEKLHRLDPTGSFE